MDSREIKFQYWNDCIYSTELIRNSTLFSMNDSYNKSPQVQSVAMISHFNFYPNLH
jgi:hypothetical protein